MSSVTLVLIIVTTIVSLPISPAYLLFKALRSRADARGPWRELELKLGGAFGGYFILVVLTFTQLASIQKTVPPAPPVTEQVWRVDRQILSDEGKPIEPLGPTHVELMPRLLDVQPNGYFEATFTHVGLAAAGGAQRSR